MSELLQLKFLVTLVIFFIALIGGLPPILMSATTKRTQNLFAYGEAFARGIFLGGGLIHLLPDAQHRFTEAFGEIDYPVVATLATFAMLTLLFIEQLSSKFFYHNNKSVFIPYLLAALLSIHSLIAGAALGIDESLAGFLIIFFAIISHKGSAAFALGISMRKASLTRPTMLKVMLLFAIMTPLGIVFGTSIEHLLEAQQGKAAEAILDAITVGTFIYIAAFHGDPLQQSESVSQVKLSYFLLLGVCLMAIIAFWA